MDTGIVLWASLDTDNRYKFNINFVDTPRGLVTVMWLVSPPKPEIDC